MTESNDGSAPPAWTPDTDPDGFELSDFTPKDGVLDLLLDFIVGIDDENTGSIGLVVQSEGSTVSGLVISRREYLQRLDALLRPGFGDEPTEIFSDIIAQNVNANRELRERREKIGLPSPPRRFLHMKDARILAGPDRINVPLWRGTLANITGWAAGSHNSPDPKD